MKGMSLNQIACACQGVYTGDEALKNREVSGVVIDSRQAEPGCLFVAVKGARVDGHSFIPTVFAKGAAAVLCERLPEHPAGPCILVDSCLEAIKRLGEGERRAYGRTLLAVTCQGHSNPLLTATSMTGSGKGIQERIVLLARRPKTAARSLALVVLVAAAAVGCTFTGAEEDGFVPDRVSMGQLLSSTSGSTITDPETVARLWDLCQGFTLGGPADPDGVWTLSVCFATEDTAKMEWFILTPDGLYSADWETYYVLEDGVELYQEFYGVYEEQQTRDRWRRA